MEISVCEEYRSAVLIKISKFVILLTLKVHNHRHPYTGFVIGRSIIDYNLQSQISVTATGQV